MTMHTEALHKDAYTSSSQDNMFVVANTRYYR